MIRYTALFITLILLSLSASALAIDPEEKSNLIEKYIRLAENGDNKAMYIIGRAFIEHPEDVPSIEYDKALSYLSKVKGEVKTESLILTGVLVAEGSDKVKPDLVAAEDIFRKANTILIDSFKEQKIISENMDRENLEEVKSYMSISIQSQDDYRLLQGLLRKYKIIIDR